MQNYTLNLRQTLKLEYLGLDSKPLQLSIRDRGIKIDPPNPLFKGINLALFFL